MDITLNNYEEYLLSYVDGELNETETAALMQFLEAHPDKKKELALLQAAVLPAEEKIYFPQKQSLYREEKPEKGKVFILKRYPWLAVVAAACVALLAILILQSRNHSKTGNLPVAIDKTTQPAVPQVKPATVAPDTMTRGLAVSKEPMKKEEESLTPATTSKRKVENNQKEQAFPSTSRPNTGQESDIAANTVKPSLPALSSLDIPAEDSEVNVIPAGSSGKIQLEDVALNQPEIPNTPADSSFNPARIQKEQIPDDKILNAAETLAVAKRGLDSTITQKLEDINEKTSGFFNHIAKNGIKIGRVTFAFNN